MNRPSESILKVSNTMDTMKNIRKRIIVILIMLLFTSVSMPGQVFIMDEDVGGNVRVGESNFNVPVPYQGTDLDEIFYAPLDGGWLLLAAMSGAYLLKRHRKDE
jgi:hypothetical protein